MTHLDGKQTMGSWERMAIGLTGAETQRVSTPQTNGGVRWASQRDNRAYTNKQG